MHDIEPYKARSIRFLKCWEIADVCFKPYLITDDTDLAPCDPLIESARQCVEATFPEICNKEGHHHGFGYVILHTGEMKTWLLVNWWAYGDIALRMLVAAEPGSVDFASQDHRHFHACVWEHVVIDYERDAWVKHMMKRKSDSKAYLCDRLRDGEY
ncbi:MAG TPA: hypothetical protein PKH39_10025 [Woeseiaceae bacterium]|nr:hypothetical protein [Woeseiaceae bacterium]